MFGFVGLGFSQYSQPKDKLEFTYVLAPEKRYVSYENVKYDVSIEHDKRMSVFNDTLNNKIIATGLGYSRTPNNIALTILIINKGSSVLRGTYVSISLDDDKKFVSTINLVLHGFNIKRKVYVFPVIGINLYHVSVKLTPEEYYMIHHKDAGDLDDGDGTIWDYDMTYSLTFGTIFIFDIGKENKQTFGVPITFSKYGISTVGILIKINSK